MNIHAGGQMLFSQAFTMFIIQVSLMYRLSEHSHRRHHVFVPRLINPLYCERILSDKRSVMNVCVSYPMIVNQPLSNNGHHQTVCGCRLVSQFWHM